MTENDRPALDEDLSALVDGELDSQASSALRARIEADPVLARRLAAFRNVGAALEALPTRAAQDPALEEIRRRIIEEVESSGPSRGRPRIAPPPRRRWAGIGAAAAAAAAAGVALLLALRGEQPAQAPAPQSPVAASQTPGDALASASDEELGIAFELEALSDFEVIEQLEVLELMVALESPERG